MKRIFTLCFFISSFFIANSTIPGADMSYVYLGSGNYKIIVTAYRDCNGIQLSGGNATITSGKTTFSFSLKTESVEDISMITKSCTKSKCAGGTFPYGFEKHVFYGIVNLGAFTNLCEFNVSWQQCCRNGAISTGAAGENFYVDMLINRCYDSTNSAPQFTMPPITTVIVNEPVTYNPVMIDSMDGYDSLSYEMVLPYNAANSGISYTGSYSLDAPLKYFGFPKTGLKSPAGFHLDNIGNIRFIPINSGEVTAIVLKVTEWKKIKGVMRIVSELKRDMQVVVTKSGNHQPQPQNYNNNFNACVGKPYTFEIPFTDVDSITFLHGRVISDIPGLTYKIIRDTAAINNKTIVKVELTPNSGMVRKNPYQFTVIVNDSSCRDLYGEFIYTYNLFIKNAIDTSAPAVIHFSKMNCNDYQFEAKDSLGFGYTNWEWFDNTTKLDSNIDMLYSATEKGAKKISLRAYREGCYVESFATIYTPILFKPTVQITSSKAATCRNADITLKANATNAINPHTYFWPDLNLTGDSITFQHDTSSYKVILTDSNKCKDSAEIKVGIFEAPGVNLGKDTSKCTNDLNGITLTANSGSNLKLFYDWHGLGNTKSITVKPKFGQNKYMVKIIDANSCFSSDTIFIDGYTLTADAGKDTLACQPISNYTLRGNTNANPSTSQFIWQNIANTKDAILDILETKTFNFIVKDIFGCSTSDIVTVSIASPPFVNLK